MPPGNPAGYMAAGGLPLGAMLTQPQIPDPRIVQGGPPPENLNLWQRFQQRLQQDPNLRMALLTTGLNMLRTPEPGKTGFDTFADSALTGVQTLDALRQRDVAAEAQARDEKREDRKIDIADETLDVRREGITQESNQFEARMKHAQEQLAETTRHNKATEKNQGSAASSTGAERQANTIKQSLMTLYPEVYAGPEGEAKANLDAMKFLSHGDDEAARARTILSLVTAQIPIQEIAETPKSAQQLLKEAEAAYDGLIRPVISTPDPIGETPDSIDGKTISTPGGVQATARSVGEGKYRLVNANGVMSNETYTAEQLQSLVVQ